MTIQPTQLEYKSKGGKVYSHIRRKWLVETPEERVRQNYLLTLVQEYGFTLDQIAEEENLTGRGSAQARADFVIWKTVEDKQLKNTPLIIIECKSDNVSIKAQDYGQGDRYARIAGAPFFVTHNSKETKYWRVRKEKMPGFLQEVENIPHANATTQEIQDLLEKLRIFKEDEFADLLHQCHKVIRNREKKDPAAAFDEIAKLLFVKIWVERRLRNKKQGKNLFTVKFLESQISDNPIQRLFEDTKEIYRNDGIFAPDEEIKLRAATVNAIVTLLERYNLSETSEDVKGIAFERFLGRTFRGEMGQFFTPRPIVEFMIRMIEPKEGEIVCDPASGSGGFLIRFYELIRQQILADIDREYQLFKTVINEDNTLSEDEKALRLTEKYDELQSSIDQSIKGSRLWRLANQHILGCDANDRMARTSKMNMIMHGDGHGGIHYHDGFVNISGIFEGRFDIVLTNPPFGSSVEQGDVVLESSRLSTDSKLYEDYLDKYGDEYAQAQLRVKNHVGKSVATLFELGTDNKGEPKKIKTEILFLERCLELLKPGGRLGIVLPEGIFNNPTLSNIRAYCEDRAYIRAIVSLPEETFKSAKASVKASLLFLEKFSVEEFSRYHILYNTCKKELLSEQATERNEIYAILKKRPKQSDFYPFGVSKPSPAQKQAARNQLVQHREQLNLQKAIARKRVAILDTEAQIKSRQLLKQKFSYSIYFYEANKVGITATGEKDENELYPNDNQPKHIPLTCLDLREKFSESDESFLIHLNQNLPSGGMSIEVMPPTPRAGAFGLEWQDVERWDTFFYRKDFMNLESQLDNIHCCELGSVCEFTSRKWNRNEFPDGQFNYIEISSVNRENGIIGSTQVSVHNAPSRATTLVKTGDMLISTTRPYLGAFAIVPEKYNDCVCSSGFALISKINSKIDPQYLLLFLKSPAGLRQLERRMTGGLYPAIVLDELKKIRIPILPPEVQRDTVNSYHNGMKKLAQDRSKAERIFQKRAESLEDLLLHVDSKQ